MTLFAGRLRDDRRRALEALQGIAEWLRVQRPLAVGEMRGLVPIRDRDVRKMDVEGCARLDHLVGGLEDAGERVFLEEAAVSDHVQAREVQHRLLPSEGTRRRRPERDG
jgi:hypothetical protein